MKPTLQNWVKEEKLKTLSATKEEIGKLFKIVNRDLDDAEIQNLSADRRFITAYNAALQLSTIALRVHGLRTNPNKTGHHRISIDALPEIFGKELQDLSDYLNACRIKRNISDYTSSGEISQTDAKEIIKEVKAFRSFITKWLKSKHPDLLPN